MTDQICLKALFLQVLRTWLWKKKGSVVLKDLSFRTRVRLSIAALGFLAVAGCNKQKLPNTAVATQDTGQTAMSNEQAARDDANKAADRDTNVALEKLRLAAAEKQAETSKDQFSQQSTNQVAIAQIQANSQNYGADQSASAQKMSALYGTFGNVGSALVSGYMGAKGQKDQAEAYKEAQIAGSKNQLDIAKEERGARTSDSYFRYLTSLNEKDRQNETAKVRSQFEQVKADQTDYQNQVAAIEALATVKGNPGTEAYDKSLTRAAETLKSNPGALSYFNKFQQMTPEKLRDHAGVLSSAITKTNSRARQLEAQREAVGMISADDPASLETRKAVEASLKNLGGSASVPGAATSAADADKALLAKAEKEEAAFKAQSAIMQEAMKAAAAKKDGSPVTKEDLTAPLASKGIKANELQVLGAVTEVNAKFQGKPDDAKTAAESLEKSTTQKLADITRAKTDFKNAPSPETRGHLEESFSESNLWTPTGLTRPPPSVTSSTGSGAIPSLGGRPIANREGAFKDSSTASKKGQGLDDATDPDEADSLASASDNDVDSGLKQQAEDLYKEIKQVAEEKKRAGPDDPELQASLDAKILGLREKIKTLTTKKYFLSGNNLDYMDKANHDLTEALDLAESDPKNFVDKYGEHSTYASMSNAQPTKTLGPVASNAENPMAGANSLFRGVDGFGSAYGSSFQVAGASGSQKNFNPQAPKASGSASGSDSNGNAVCLVGDKGC